MALCSMCPQVTFGNRRAPGYGWICICGEVNCSHQLNCTVCESNRYDMEKTRLIQKGKPVKVCRCGHPVARHQHVIVTTDDRCTEPGCNCPGYTSL